MENNDLYDGAFQLARKLFESTIWLKKPSQWGKIWIYIIGKVNHKNKNGFERGQRFFNFSEEIRNIGNDITYHQIISFLKFAKTTKMITTTKTTRGIVIKVLKYDYFQTLGNYKTITETTTKTTSEPQQNHNRTITINNNDKNDKKDKNSIATPFERFWTAYPKKVGRKPTQRKFSTLKEEIMPKIFEELEKQKLSKQWREGFIPNPLTWLNQERWNDETSPITREQEAHALVEQCRPQFGNDAEEAAMFKFSAKYGNEEMLKYKGIFKL